MRGWTAFAAGAVAALIVSRMLPPLAGQAAGMARAAAGRDPFDALAHDHRQILALLAKLEHSPPHAMSRMQLLMRLKRRLGAHALAEEDVVYPLLHDWAGETEDTRRLYAEHADMKMHLFALEQSLTDEASWGERARALHALVAGHVRQEEEVDFPRLRARLDKRKTAMLAGGVQREKAMML